MRTLIRVTFWGWSRAVRSLSTKQLSIPQREKEINARIASPVRIGSYGRLSSFYIPLIATSSMNMTQP